MSTWFPPIQDDALSPGKAGQWQGRSARELTGASSGLVLDGVTTRINSLPTPWSRAVQMEQAVQDEHYPNREKLLNELFGGLAAAGLSEVYGLKLTAKRQSLTRLRESKNQDVRRFASSLLAQRPQESLSQSLSWDDLTIYTIRDAKDRKQPIGFASPSTILCPTAQLRFPIAGLPWGQQGDQFSDPTPHLLLEDHKQSLAGWIKLLLDDIHKLDEANTGLTENLNRVLQSFIKRLDVTDKRVKRGNKLTDVGACVLTYVAAPVESEDSHCRVILEDKQTENSKPVILVDNNMPWQLRKETNQIQLYGSDTLATIDGDPEKLRRNRRIDVVTPSDLFLDKLTLLPGGALGDLEERGKDNKYCNSWLPEKLTARLDVDDQEDFIPLLPFKARVQELFSSRDLKEMVSLTVNEGTLEVALTLTLQGSKGKETEEYLLKRSYPLTFRDTRVLRTIPVMAIWPAIPPGAGWSKYWIFSQMVDGLSLETSKGWQGPHRVEFGDERMHYLSSGSFPDLLKVSVDQEESGLIPLELPKPVGVKNDRWNVGLDFGTSFTNWAISDDNQSPGRLPLESALYPVTVANDQVQRELLNGYFIPQIMNPTGNNPPVATSLSVVGCAQRKLDSQEAPELFHEARLHIPWPDETSKSRLRTGFKWEDPELKEPFLRQLALMISAHAKLKGVTTMIWSLSYPTALSPNIRRTYKRIWEELTKEMEEISGLDHKLRENRPLMSEAVTFACCMDDAGKDFQHTACLDIGGGTTDISLWQGSDLIHQVSVPFAGQHICTRILDHHPEFTARLLNRTLLYGGESNNQRMAGQRMESNRLSLIDNYLRFSNDVLFGDGKKLRRQRGQVRAERDQALEELISLMSLAMGGIYHYLGFIVRCLYDREILKKGSPMSVYVGGNGGRFLHWLDPTAQFNEDSKLNQWLSRIQAFAINSNMDKFSGGETHLSDKLKDEAAIGLVVNAPHLTGLDKLNQPFSGEALRINDYGFAAEEPIDLSIFGDNETVEKIELLNLKELQRYVEGMAKAMEGIKDDLQLTPLVRASDLEGNLGERVLCRASDLCDKHRGQAGARTVDELSDVPGFFFGLRALVEELTEDWAKDKLTRRGL